jgi:hypothetical protein
MQNIKIENQTLVLVWNENYPYGWYYWLKNVNRFGEEMINQLVENRRREKDRLLCCRDCLVILWIFSGYSLNIL